MVALLLVGTLAFSLAACGGNGDKKTKGSDAVVIDLSAEPGDLNTTISNDIASFDIQRMTVAGLIKLDENDQPQPDMAESWDISDGKTTYTMHMHGQKYVARKQRHHMDLSFMIILKMVKSFLVR